jgi:F-type H+-transporting ATPase subunit gamma
MIHNIIFGGILESYASEHSARMFAMKNATDNAGDLQKDLKLYFNRARQGAVTQEIAEITSGAMALTT